MQETRTFLLFLILVQGIFAQTDSSVRVLINDNSWTSLESSLIGKDSNLYLLIHGDYNSGITKISPQFSSAQARYYYESAATVSAFEPNTITATSDSTLWLTGRRLMNGNSETGVIAQFDLGLEAQWSKSYLPNGVSAFRWTGISPLSGSQFFLTGKDNANTTYLAISDEQGNISWSSKISGTMSPVRSASLNDSTIIVSGNVLNPNQTIAAALLFAVHRTNGTIVWQQEIANYEMRDLLVHNDSIYTLINDQSSQMILQKRSPDGTFSENYMLPIWSSFILDAHKLYADNDRIYVLTGSMGVFDSKITVIEFANMMVYQSQFMMNLRQLLFSDSGNEYILGEGPVYGIKSTLNTKDHVGIVETADIFTYLQGPICADPLSFQNTGLIGISENTGNISLSANTFQIDSYTLSPDTAQSTIYVGCVDATGGIEERLIELIEAFPNPSSRNFTIENRSQSTQRLAIFDQVGRPIIESFQIAAGSQFQLTLNQKGSYFLAVMQNGNWQVAQKLLVIQ